MTASGKHKILRSHLRALMYHSQEILVWIWSSWEDNAPAAWHPGFFTSCHGILLAQEFESRLNCSFGNILWTRGLESQRTAQRWHKSSSRERIAHNGACVPRQNRQWSLTTDMDPVHLVMRLVAMGPKEKSILTERLKYLSALNKALGTWLS